MTWSVMSETLYKGDKIMHKLQSDDTYLKHKKRGYSVTENSGNGIHGLGKQFRRPDKWYRTLTVKKSYAPR